MQPFEKLGAFYLGQEYDLAAGKRLDRLLMYDARDLTTHAVCVGMTGSGKTGLCVDLLEEAAIDSVPAIYHEQSLDLYYNPILKLYGQPGESEHDFNYHARKREELLSTGETLASLLGIGRRRSTTALSRVATKHRLTTSAKADIEESEAEIARLQDEIEDMRRDVEEAARAITEKWAATLDDIETYAVKPCRSDVGVELVALAGAPHWEVGYRSARGGLTHDRMPAWH
jgi:hypothetical protein